MELLDRLQDNQIFLVVFIYLFDQVKMLIS